MAVASLVYDCPALSAFELDSVDAGERCRLPPGQAWNRRFESGDPVREFRWAKGGQGFAGWYFSATVGDHVGYESWLERDRPILLDRDPNVLGIASQPWRGVDLLFATTDLYNRGIPLRLAAERYRFRPKDLRKPCSKRNPASSPATSLAGTPRTANS
ncbi:hypothetical protein AB0F71_31885 [Kitasatospora sp. NPDC028055]|uniref:hypothetical protein n=1 Tax=Kitasatospora sp. NPDC028055 TaxID=3155653 RepID=UPI0033F5B281